MRVLDLLERIALALAWIAMAEMAALVLAMCWEVTARYGFNAPTLWSFDISLMLNGTMYLLAAGYALREDAHVRIDVLSRRLPPAVQHLVAASVLLLLFVPCIAWLAYTGVVEAADAYLKGERELSSAWGPLVWPAYAGMAVGLIGLALQSLVRGLRHLAALRDPAALSLPRA